MNKLFTLIGLLLPFLGNAQIRYVNVLRIGKFNCVEVTRKIIRNPNGAVNYTRVDLTVTDKGLENLEFTDTEAKELLGGFKTVLNADYAKKNGFEREVLYANPKLSAAGSLFNDETEPRFVVTTMTLLKNSCTYRKAEFEELIRLLQVALDSKNKEP